MELQALVCGCFWMSLSSLMLNLFWNWGWSRYRGFSKTSSGDLYHVGTSKLICETNRWTSLCVMRFLPEGYSEQTMILHLCGSGKYISVLCFSISGGDARVPAPSRTWGVESFFEHSLMCWVITGLGCVSHFEIQFLTFSDLVTSRRYHSTVTTMLQGQSQLAEDRRLNAMILYLKTCLFI